MHCGGRWNHLYQCCIEKNWKETKNGARIVQKILLKPIKQIAENAGVDGSGLDTMPILKCSRVCLRLI